MLTVYKNHANNWQQSTKVILTVVWGCTSAKCLRQNANMFTNNLQGPNKSQARSLQESTSVVLTVYKNLQGLRWQSTGDYKNLANSLQESTRIMLTAYKSLQESC